MIIMSHRGYWKTPEEKNEVIAFQRSFGLGYGTETDVRDLCGKLVISHDMPGENALPLDKFLPLTGTAPLPLAINVKADGLAIPLREAFKNSPHEWFVFDMSVPDTRQQLNAGNPVYVRMSEVEKNPPWIDEARGVWLDAFTEQWWTPEVVRSLLRRGLKVCVVSAELHKRDHRSMWKSLLPLRDEPNLMLCTDIPEDATVFFRP